METIKSEDRGQFDHGWLKTAHSFSFANYVHPNRHGFGDLLVLNDDWILPGRGFGTHPHANMEIISIPLEGQIAHKDTLGHAFVLEPGDVQLMSAGTGIAHSEYNASKEQSLNFLQIWIKPNTQNLEPSYQQTQFTRVKDAWQVLVSENGDDGSLVIHQKASIRYLDSIGKAHALSSHSTSGYYVFVIEGQVRINGQVLNKRDALQVGPAHDLSFDSDSAYKLIVIQTQLK